MINNFVQTTLNTTITTTSDRIVLDTPPTPYSLPHSSGGTFIIVDNICALSRYEVVKYSGYEADNQTAIITERGVDNSGAQSWGVGAIILQLPTANDLNDIQTQLNNTYNKTKTDNLLNGKADKSTTYTKTETDNLLDDKADKSGSSSQVFAVAEPTANEHAIRKIDLDNHSNYFIKSKRPSGHNNYRPAISVISFYLPQNGIVELDWYSDEYKDLFNGNNSLRIEIGGSIVVSQFPILWLTQTTASVNGVNFTPKMNIDQDPSNRLTVMTNRIYYIGNNIPVVSTLENIIYIYHTGTKIGFRSGGAILSYGETNLTIFGR